MAAGRRQRLPHKAWPYRARARTVLPDSTALLPPHPGHPPGGVASAPGACLRSRLHARPRAELPPRAVLRCPANWGWIIDGCWSVETSFPMPGSVEDTLLADTNLPITVQAVQPEVDKYVRCGGRPGDVTNVLAGVDVD